MTDSLKKVISTIESAMVRYYGISLELSACDYLVSKGELRDLLGDQAPASENWYARASVWVERASSTEGFIGIHFSEGVARQLNDNDPTRGITHENLDSFCVVAEEVSHFHQLVNHLTGHTSASPLELETQGEIDKVLIAGVLLAEDHGNAYLSALTRKVYGEAVITAENKELYRQASKLAQSLWQNLMNLVPHHRNILAEPDISSHLQKIFAAKGGEKLKHITQIPRSAA